MPALMRPWTVRVLELVDQGTTHRNDIVEATMAYVPMGHAYRAREQQRQSQHRRPRQTDRTLVPREKSLAEVHRIGARAVVRASMRTLVAHGHLVRDGEHLRRPSSQAPAVPAVPEEARS